MTPTIIHASRQERGFTLVELAIVMIIIGLLIGGILKGQELIANAQIASAVSQVKGLDGAVSTFREAYNAFPGDMSTATNRLSNCAGANCTDGNGNGQVGVAVGAIAAGEALAFFEHLRVADLITGMDGSVAAAGFGTSLPTASIGGGYTVGHTAVGAGNFTGPDLRSGHYIVFSNNPATAAGGANAPLSATQAARIDRKLDDGAPNTGAAQASTGDCGAGAATDIYDEADAALNCSLAVRIQG